MKRNEFKLASGGFTLVEILISLAVLVIVGGLAYSILTGSTTLLAKNLSLNSSNTIVRGTLDRAYSELNQANGMPLNGGSIPGKLINYDGTPSMTANPDGSFGPAAGIFFDRYVSGPFVVGNPATGLPANTTSLKLFYSTDPLASPIAPTTNDVVIMDGVTRALVSTCSTPSGYSAPIPNPTPVSGNMLTVTLQNTLGTYTNPQGNAISWSPSVQQTAYVLHRKAFVVVPVTGRTELRMYPNAEIIKDVNDPGYNPASIASYIADPNNYIVLSREIGTQAGENTPFAIVNQDAQGNSLGANFLRIALRVKDQQFNNYLANKEAKEFNTFLRVDARSRPRNFLQ